MIKRIDIKHRKSTEKVLNLQIPSYLVEAETIGCYDIPPLKDTIKTLQQCKETFFGYYIEGKLCGAISININNDEIDIHRLIVHPSHFKKGIAQILLNYIENNFVVGTIKVATGSKNIPAVSFYEKNEFQKVNEFIVSEQLSLSFFEKNL